MAILNNNPLIGASGNQGGYNINNSLRFRSSASAYLNRTLTTPTNNKIWTYSAWVKRGTIASSSQQHFFNYWTGGTGQSGILFSATTDTIEFFDYTGSYGYQLVTTQVFRDPSAWYHIVVVMDTTQATSSNRIKMYVNGTQITAFSTSTYPSLNYNTLINSANAHYIGRRGDAAGYFDGYIAEQNFIDGQALTPSSFGETDTTTGVWKPKAYSGTYGTNGFYLKFSDIATTSGSNAGLGKDFSGNTNYWTTNNISVTAGTTYDAMTDSPTNTSATVANYAVLNPLTSTAGYMTYANANLYATIGAQDKVVYGTIAIPTSGKYYFEWTISTVGLATSFGVSTEVTQGTGTGFSGGVQRWYDWKPAGAVANDVLMTAIDMDNGKIWFGKNGTWNSSGNPATGANPAHSDMLTAGGSNPWLAATYLNSANGNANFGQRPFAYTPPTGFNRLNTYNLPDSTIKKGSDYMNAVLYTGDGTNGRAITTGMATDFAWIKKRSAADNHELQDRVRGAAKRLQSNSTAAEVAISAVASFTSTGFTVDGWGTTNENGFTYVAWSWLANGSGSSNTAGSITSTVSANTTAGFSIVTYTGTGANATVGHGLGVAPRMIIAKRRNTTQDWGVYHASVGNTGALALNLTIATDTNIAYFNNTSPTSSVFSVGTGSAFNANTGTYVAYCFAEIAGFSRFGSYTGNGSTDGPFVYTGFRPKFIMYKRTDATQSWIPMDTSRSPYNVADKFLLANASDSEYTGTILDMLSNGFKIREAGTQTNASGGTYIFMAFAESPFSSNNRAR